MNTPRVVEAMNFIDDDLVSGAVTYSRKKKSNWLKWGAMAACLCLMIAVFLSPSRKNRQKKAQKNGMNRSNT